MHIMRKTMLEIVFKICWNMLYMNMGLAQENIFFLYLKYTQKHM